jgi:hypothetical protein
VNTPNYTAISRVKSHQQPQFELITPQVSTLSPMSSTSPPTASEVEPDMPPVYCVVAATNLSKRSKIPRTDIIEKAKEFLGTTEELKWYYVVKA